MRLVTGKEMALIDRVTINDYAIPGVVLMENAGLRVTDVICQTIGNPQNLSALILVGHGNNGGDGFVIARHLYNKGTKVKLFLYGNQDKINGDALINFNIWKMLGQEVFPLANSHDANILKAALHNTDFVIDALYGTGFKGKVDDNLGLIIKSINNCGKTIFSVDIPSGMEADSGRVNGPCIQAEHTVTFAYPKLGMVLHPGCEYIGKLHVVDISIPNQALSKVSSNGYLLTKEFINNVLPKRTGLEHKGDLGRVLIIAGSRGMSGAAVLAAESAARAGAGLVTLGVPACIHDIAENKLTEVMTFPLNDTTKGTISHTAIKEILDRCHNFDVLAIGPGLGSNQETQQLVKDVLMNINIPCVLDADGLNALAGKTHLLKNLKTELVVTPHPGEMSRLTGLSIKDIQKDRLGITVGKAKEWGCTVLLKGAGTIISNSDSFFINDTGNPGMASGGTGDVLTGLIAGLIAQGMTPVNAAAAGAFIHGQAGDLAACDKGMAGMLAVDLLQRIPQALREFE